LKEPKVRRNWRFSQTTSPSSDVNQILRVGWSLGYVSSWF